MSDDSIKKTISVALGVCFVCSILVSIAAVKLKDIQDEKKKLDKVKNILLAGDLLKEGVDVNTVYTESIKAVMIDLKTGEPVSEANFNDVLNIETFDINSMAKHAEYGQAIPADKDIAAIKRMPKNMVVYQVVENDSVEKIILPIYGKGLWSTLYGFIALSNDLKTVQGFTFYQHGETPGLGGEVDNPSWKSTWKGKQVFDADWNLKIEVIKGKVDKSKDDAKYKVDGLSGSTLTTRGVDQLVKFWLGENGYGRYIKKLQEEFING